jgi:hypothetical protein
MVREMDRRIEYILGATAVIWGLIVVNPYVDAFNSSITFRAMAAVASETAWGSVFITIGLIGLIATWHYARMTLYRRVAILLNMFAWATLAIFYYMGNPSGTGYVVYAILAAIDYVLVQENT